MHFSILLLRDVHPASLSWSWVARSVKVLVLLTVFQNAGVWSAWIILCETAEFNNFRGCAQTIHKVVLMYLGRSSNAVEKRLQVTIMK